MKTLLQFCTQPDLNLLWHLISVCKAWDYSKIFFTIVKMLLKLIANYLKYVFFLNKASIMFMNKINTAMLFLFSKYFFHINLPFNIVTFKYKYIGYAK